MSSFSIIRRSVLAGLVMAGTTGVAAAGTDVTVATTTPTPVDTAQTRADAERARADSLARQGGWAYKSGAYDRAKAEAYSCQAEADAAYVATTEPPPSPSPALDDALDRLDWLKANGGWAYKSGAVARAEADVARLRAAEGQEVQIGAVVTPPPANWDKPVERTEPTYR